MDTRERVIESILDCTCSDYPHAAAAANAICDIFAEERAALVAAMRDATGMDDEEIDNAGLAHLIEELARARDESAEAAEAREAKLVELLVRLRDYLNEVNDDHRYYSDDTEPLINEIDAALATVKEGK